MKILFISVAVIALLILAAGFVPGVKSKQPPTPGLAAGYLRDCPASPNCVNSEAGTDESHRVAPIASIDWNGFVHAVEQAGGNILENENGYLHAVFTSALFRFVDDLEARMDRKAKLIHIRSASRAGHSDMGVNRKRVEKIRARVNKR